MINLTEKEKGYIEDFINALETFRLENITAKNLCLTGMDMCKKLGEKRYSYSQILNSSLSKMQDFFNNTSSIEMLLEEYITDYSECISGDWREDIFSLFAHQHSLMLHYMNEILRTDKNSYNLRKIKVDFLFLHPIEKDIAKGLVEKVDSDYQKCREDKDFFRSFVGKYRENIGEFNYERILKLIDVIPDDKYLEFVDTEFENTFDTVKPYRMLKKFYFDKKETFTMEDIPYIEIALDELEVHEDIKGIVINSLEKKIRDRRKKEISSAVIKKEVKVGRTFNEIQTDLLKYYNLDKMEIISNSYITNEEVIYCVTLLKELKASKGQIEIFMGRVNFFNNNYKKELRHSPVSNEEDTQKELSKYYDVKNNTIVTDRYITKEEIVHCVFMMIALKISKEEIELFLKNIHISNKLLLERDSSVDKKFNKDFVCSVQVFEDLYEKIEYYSTYFGFGKEFREGICSTYELCQMIELNTIEDCLEYYEYQKVLRDELNNILSWIKPYNIANYEIDMVSQCDVKSNTRTKNRPKV